MRSLFRLSQRRGFFGSRSKPQAATTKLYDLLGLNQQASEDEIKKAFKQLALKHHPDRGGDADKFKEIAQAYEVLSDPEKRRVYDTFGEEGLEGRSGPAGGDPHDIFSQMFGGNRGTRVMKTPDALHRIELSLEDMFNGINRAIRFSRDVICKKCKGQGASKTDTCRRCGGSGTVLTRQNIGFMVAMQSTCPDCTGKGFRVPPGCQCVACSGNGRVTEKEVFDIRIPKGCENRQRFVFPGKADEMPGHVAGDVIIEVVQKAHDRFVRIGSDLYLKQKVSLADALSGVKFVHTHLDGKSSTISGSDEIVKPGTIWKVPGFGMGPGGSLFVRFEIEFPDSLKTNTDLAKLVSALKKPAVDDNVKGVIEAKRLSESDCREVVKKLEAKSAKKETRDDAEDANQCVQQ